MLEPISKIMLISMSIYIYMNFTDLIGMTLPRDTLNTKKHQKRTESARSRLFHAPKASLK